MSRIDNFALLLGDPRYIMLLCVALVAGTVRGFSGFGTAMVVGPVAAALFLPIAAIVTIFVMDLAPANIPVLQTGKKAARRELPFRCADSSLPARPGSASLPTAPIAASPWR